MLLEKIHEEIQASGLGAGNDFKIAASAKAFEILSSNLYQDKILAVIRELSCNAADAHTIVGKSLSEIQIKLPTWDNLTFKVRDFGPGLSDEDVRHLYTTYFQSTKDSSNAVIGGFGLGSKSPFAVVDQFNVRSFHGGFVRTYVCYKNNGIPAINFISAEPSTETGLEVSFAVPSTGSQGYGTSCADTWHARANSYFQWWPQAPKIIPDNSTITFIGATRGLSSQHIVATNGQPLWFVTNGVSRPHVWMGLVPYALNLSSIPSLPPEIISAFETSGLILNIPIGGVEISPSREALSYDPKTCAVITKLLQAIYKEVTAELVSELDKCGTLYEARQFIYADNSPIASLKGSSLFRSLKNIKTGLRWKGQPLESAVNIDFYPINKNLPSDYYNVATLSKPSYRSTWRKSTAGTSVHHRFNTYDNTYFVWAPHVTAKTYATVQHYADLNKLTTSRDLVFFIITGQTFADAAKIFDAEGFPPLLDISTFPPPPKVASNKTKTSINTQGYTFAANEFEPTAQPIDLSSGGLYSPLFNGKVNVSYNNQTWLRENQIYELFRTSLMDTAKQTKPLGLKISTLETKKVQKNLAAHNWKPLTWDMIVNLVPAADLEKHLRALRLGFLMSDQTTKAPRYLLNFSRRLHSDRLEFFARFIPTLYACGAGQKFFAPYEVTLKPFVDLSRKDYGAGSWWHTFSGLTAHPVAVPMLDKIEQEIFALDTALQKMVAEHPLLWYIDLSNEELPYADLLSYLSRND
jgi:hypothetical protein